MIQRALQPLINQQLYEYPGKPVLLSGAAGTGKFTLAQAIASDFSQQILLDMMQTSDRKLFENEDSTELVLKSIFFNRNRNFQNRKTLILIREIGISPAACRQVMEWGRQSVPFQVICTNSRQNDFFETDGAGRPAPIASFHVAPLSFDEFLCASGDQALSGAFREVPLPRFAWEKLLRAFHLYSLIGGMPEAAESWFENEKLTSLAPIYEKALESLFRMIRLQSSSAATSSRAVETLQNAFPYAATRITFRNFGNTAAGSREAMKAMQVLEQVWALTLVWPSTSTTIESTVTEKKSPRIHLLDTGLVTYFSGIQQTLCRAEDMTSLFEGQVARQAAGQELIPPGAPPKFSFWVRNKSQSTAEVDFTLPYHDLLIPVVVKAGQAGRLRGLHRFIDEAPHPYAVRLSSEPVSVGQHTTLGGKKYFLLNLPYFLASRIREHLPGFIRLIRE